MREGHHRVRALLVTILALSALATSALAQLGTAPDATANGPLTVRNAEYKFHRGINADVLAGRQTELWGVVWHPTDLSRGPFPVIVFLHGNHGTCGIGSNPRSDSNCQYTSSGTCPPGFVVTPNHRGYDYMAQKLASWGYFVVSINANLGITCGGGVAGDGGLNLARGRLVLKHLSLLSVWNMVGSAGLIGLADNALLGKLDLQNVGLMGHSRGGEGVRAAYQQYRDSGSPWPTAIFGGANIKAIYEIGPVDGQTSRVLNADGTTWNVLLPMCDGDVSDLQGVKPFDRMMAMTGENPARQKSTYTVWGTNHNFYNTEWQTPDSTSCLGHSILPRQTTGSADQRRQGEVSLLAFFRGNLSSPIPGAYNPAFNQTFNTQYSLISLPSRVDRAFTYSPNSGVTMRLDDCTGGPSRTPTGITFSTVGSIPNQPIPACQISWSGGGAHSLNTDFGPRNLSGFSTLEMLVARQNSGLNPAGPTNFTIQLVNGNGTLSGAVNLNAYTDLRGPVGGPGGIHPILQTARIRLRDFSGATLGSIRGVRLTFNSTPSGAIWVTDIRAANRSGSGATEEDFYYDDTDYITSDTVETVDNSATNVINSIRRVESSQALDNTDAVEIELLTSREVEPKNELVILKVGEQEFELGRYPEDGDLHSLTFTLTPDQWDQIATGEEVLLQYGRGEGREVRSFGRLDKDMLEGSK